MHYPGDRISLYCSLPGMEVSTVPQVSVLSSSDVAVNLDADGSKSAAMSLVPGTDGLYKYVWDTQQALDGTYAVVVSYVAGETVVTGQFLKEVQLGDARIRQQVASAVQANDILNLYSSASLMRKSDFVAPQDDPFVQAIKTKVDSLPENVATEESLTALAGALADVRDCELGTWTLDKTVTPNRMTFYRIDGTVLASYDLVHNNSMDTRTRR